MNLHETGDIVTPVDDPCQFNPAWRAIVASYLFTVGVHTPEDFKSLAVSGCLVVNRMVAENSVTENPASKTKGKTAKKKTPPKKVSAKANRPVSPFYENPGYRIFASDPWIQAQVRMVEEQAHGRLSDASVPFRLASRWYSEVDSEAAMKKRLEPLLLTEIGMDIITLDLIGLPSVQPAVEAYEKLYFNCRDENFNRNPSMQLIQRLAMPWGPLKMFCRKWEELDEDGFVIGDGRPIARDSDVWRAVAATMGYETLMYLWRWDRQAHGLKDRSLARMLEISWQVAAARLLSDLYSGEISHEDASRVLSAYTSQSKFITDSKSGGSGAGSNDTTKALMAVLYQTSPHMISIDDDAAGVASRNDEIQGRIQSQLAIAKQKVDDKGTQVEHEIIDAQISEAISQ